MPTHPHHHASSSSRPQSPRLSIYRWQTTMIASILHRISGGMLIISMLVSIYLFSYIISNTENLFITIDWMRSWQGTLFLWLFGITATYHWSNGLRFLLLDYGIGESRERMKQSANLVLWTIPLSAITLGTWLWL